MTNKTPETLSWKASNYIQPKRSPGWYLIFAFVALGLIAFAVYNQSLLMGATFVLIVVVILILSTQPSSQITYKITKTSIVVGNTAYPFKIIKKFWIIYEPQVKTLNFETTAYLNNQVILQLGNQDPLIIKQILSQYLIEDIEKEESLTQTLARTFKI